MSGHVVHTRPSQRMDTADTFIPFDLAQITSAVNRTTVEAGGPAWPLNTSAQAHVAYNWQSGGDVRHSFGKPTLQANQTPAVGVRRLTPIECERLQGFPDNFTRAGLTNVRQCGNITATQLRRLLPCLPNAEWMDAIGQLLTGQTKFALCTTSASKDGALLISRNAEKSENLPSAKSAIGWWDMMEHEAGVRAIISHGNAMVTLYNPNATSKSAAETVTDMQKVKTDADHTWLWLKLQLAETYSPERESTISTWINAMMRLLTSTSTPVTQRICGGIVLWNQLLKNSSQEESFTLQTADIVLQSDSARYRQLGNAVAVPVIEWIGRQLMAVTP